MSSPIFITRNGEETAFAKPLKRAVLRDKRLSFAARGLFCMLWDFPLNWSFYISNIVNLSPGGVSQLRGYVRELKKIGAIEISPRRITREDAMEMSNKERTFKAGQFLGHIWRLNHPDNWAIEAPLSKKPNYQFSAFRLFDDSENSHVESSDTKGFKNKGSENLIPPPLQPQAEVNLEKREYIYPSQLNTQERKIAESLVLTLNAETGQALLDELSARLSQNKIHSSPLSYFRGMVQRAQNGQFTPEAGIAVAHKREQQLNERSIFEKRNSAQKPNSADLQKHIQKMHDTLRKEIK